MAAMGMNANDIISAMPGVISAAEASGSDMAQTADVMASTLNIFSLKGNRGV
jgi:TP901 family phage tail tape measure protein